MKVKKPAVKEPPSGCTEGFMPDLVQGMVTGTPQQALPACRTATGPATPGKAIIPDEEGAVTVQGGRTRQRMRFMGKHLPRLHCGNCPHTDTCPKYREGYECAYMAVILKDIHGIGDAEAALHALAEAELARAQLAILHEQFAGGAASEQTTFILDSAWRKVKELREMMRESRGKDDAPKGVIKTLFASITVQPGKVIDVTPLPAKKGADQE